VDLSVTHDVDPSGRDRLTAQGSIDLASREQFLEAGRKALRDGATTLAIDLSGVTFMDSTGIGSLVELTRDAEDGGAGIVLVSPSDRIVRLLEITGLADTWPVEA
jgi:anti-sigma B factor antagonist